MKSFAKLSILFLVCVAASPKPPTTFISFQQMLATIPESKRPTDVKKMSDLKREELNDILQKEVVNHDAKIKFEVGKVGDGKKPHEGKLLVCSTVTRIEGVNVQIWTYFDTKNKDQVADIENGRTVEIAGTVTRCRFTYADWLMIDLEDCKIPQK